MNIYIGNLDRQADEREVKQLFEEFGEVKSVKIVKDYATGESKGFAFVEMKDTTSATNAIKALDSKRLANRTLKVNEAKPRNASPRSYNSFSSYYGFKDRFKH